MKYVLLGTLNADWAGKHADRIAKARGKADALRIKLESIHYTQGHYDFVDIVDAPNPEAAVAFSLWYAAQGFGRIETLPAFDSASFEGIVKLAKG